MSGGIGDDVKAQTESLIAGIETALADEDSAVAHSRARS